MNTSLKQALKSAQRSPGMVSVAVRYNPYAKLWEAEASWSDNYRIKSEDWETPEDAVTGLINLLNDTPPRSLNTEV